MDEKELKKFEERHTAKNWDDFADVWAHELKEGLAYKDSTDSRISSVTAFLRSKGLLDIDQDVIDVGSGPCRFAAAFAQTARHVTATDISPKMLEHGEAFCREQRLENMDFIPCDFTNADLADLGWEHRFDLAYASITPALSGRKGMENFIGLSRAYCCNTGFVLYRSSLEAEVRRYLGITERPYWDGTRFSTFLNRLYDMGYLPEVHFHQHMGIEREYVNKKLAGTLAFWCSRDWGEDDTLSDRILGYLEKKAEPTGGILEYQLNVWYATTLWDVRVKDRKDGKTERKTKRTKVEEGERAECNL